MTTIDLASATLKVQSSALDIRARFSVVQVRLIFTNILMDAALD